MYSDACVQLTKRSEGLRLVVNTDPAGYGEIGYGHKLKPGESFPAGITEAQANAMLAADLTEAWQAVQQLCIPPIPLTQGQVDALTDFTYNLGRKRLQSSTLLRCINSGHYDEAARQFDLWIFGGGRVLPGLVIRRKAEQAMFESS